MDEKEKGILDEIEGLRPVDETEIADFKRIMVEKVIPDILRAVEERRVSAAESRQWQLKY